MRSVQNQSSEEDNELRQQNITYILNKIINNDSYLYQIAKKLGYVTDFNETFWKFPQTLWHCTQPENVQDILQDGLLAKNRSRSLSNRSVMSSVFTTMESEEITHNQNSYGESILEINTRAMKSDGVAPFVSMEPDWENALLLAAVYTKLTKKEHYDEHFISQSEGTSKYTVIIHDTVPPKYLKQI